MTNRFSPPVHVLIPLRFQLEAWYGLQRMFGSNQTPVRQSPSLTPCQRRRMWPGSARIAWVAADPFPTLNPLFVIPHAVTVSVEKVSYDFWRIFPYQSPEIIPTTQNIGRVL